MRKIVLFLVLVPSLILSQSESEVDVLTKIIEFTLDKEQSQLYLECTKARISFKATIFNDRSSLKVPQHVLEDLEKNVKNSKINDWDLKSLDETFESDYFINKNCLTKEDLQGLTENTKNQYTVLSISNLVFDDLEENCIVSFRFIKSATHQFGYTFFLKKVYGRWTILDKYDYWMT